MFNSHRLSEQDEPAVAVDEFVQGIPFPTKLLQVVYVPLYSEQISYVSTHPAPFVKHPFLKAAHAAFVVVVIGALEQAKRLQVVAGF